MKICENGIIREMTAEEITAIPYDGNMELESGKYYTQSGMTYLCSRDTVNPVYNALSELAGIYVEVIN